MVYRRGRPGSWNHLPADRRIGPLTAGVYNVAENIIPLAAGDGGIAEPVAALLILPYEPGETAGLRRLQLRAGV